jgi:ubiquitin carboxyl-terminal hydrolase 1
MNDREWEMQSTVPREQQHHLQDPVISFSTLQKTITTLTLLILAYYVLQLIDVWPDTFKRSLYDVAVYLVPSPAIYTLQAVMHRLSGAIDDANRFKKSDYGNPRAKAEAIQRILGHSPFPTALRKARSLSGVEKILPASKELGPPGLGNWDNSCYQNSVLQGLASLPAFRKYIGKSLDLCEHIDVPVATHEALETFLEQLGTTSNRKTTLWTPAVLKSMDSWQQQDAQEYFSRVVEAVEKEDIQAYQVLKKRSGPGLTKPSNGHRSQEKGVSILTQVTVTEKEQTPPTLRPKLATSEIAKITEAFPRSPMDGMLAQALECQTCGFSEGYSLNQFNCLTLNLGLRGHSYLEDLLDDYTDAEMIEGVECTECAKAAAKEEGESDAAQDDQDGPSPSERPKLKPVYRTKAKQITIGRLPKDLVIHINRSIFDNYGEQRKNTSLLRFPSKLDFLARWCPSLSAEEDKIQMQYELKCVVTHHGRHDNGHYVALGKREKNWYVFNDEVVTKLNEEEVLSRGNVFMLFYEAVPSTALIEPRQPIAHLEDTGSPVVFAGNETLGSGSSSPESEPQAYEDAIDPVTPVPAMRTASGSLLPTEKQEPELITPPLSVS